MIRENFDPVPDCKPAPSYCLSERQHSPGSSIAHGRSNSRPMRKRHAIQLGLGLCLAIGALLISLSSGRPGLSMTLVEFRRWPHGATLRLTNGTRMTIQYLGESDGTPAGSPILCRQQTSSGWTDKSLAVRSAMAANPKTLKTREVFYLVDPAALPKPGARLNAVRERELKPGRSVEFFVRLEPDALPRRIGTICCIPQGPITRKVQGYLYRIKRWCGVESTLPGQMEVWCSKPLHVSASQPPAAEN